MKEKIEMGFVILHYVTIKDTMACIQSIRNCINGCSYRIVVVDNCSMDGSGEKLLKMYADDPGITVLISKVNLGFARGNNLGITYFKEKYDVDFIIVSNNDILLMQNDFAEKLYCSFKKYHFDLMGPMVLTADGKFTSNPQKKELWNLEELRTYKKELRHLYYANQLCLRRFYSLLHPKKHIPNFISEELIYPMINVQVHGCFFVLSREFFKKLPGLNPNTFMYMEEDILFTELMQANGVSVYDPTLIIFHQKGKSTGKLNAQKRKKYSFLLKNLLRSSDVLEKVLQGEHNE